MKRLTNEEKINKINNDRLLVLNKIKENINNNSSNINESINLALDIIKYDENNIKKYKAVLSAQSLINDLTNQIINASTVEEIENIRKKINYYINMIKREFAKRGINENELEIFKNITGYLRKGISSYIRFLKREKNIKDIMAYNSSLDTLNDDDRLKYKKLVNNELKYNKRALDDNYSYSKNSKKNNNRKSLKEDINNANYLEFDSLEIKKKNKTRDDAFNDFVRQIAECQALKNDDNSSEDDSLERKFINSLIDRKIVIIGNDDLQIEDTTENKTYFDYNYAFNRINTLKEQYGIVKPLRYEHASLKNMIIFFRNIPRYVSNKKKIKRMEMDSRIYYSGDDLLGYISYLKKSNSIFRSFGQLFSKANLFSKENVYLNNHNKCVDWILDYFKENAFGFNARTKTL